MKSSILALALALVEARERACDEIMDEALAQLDVAEAEVGRLRERLARVEA